LVAFFLRPWWHFRLSPIADARRLLLRSAFKQPVTELLRHEALRPLPSLVIVAAEREELFEHDALGSCIDGSRLRPLHERAHLMKAADDQDLRAGL
jgi:hypothetical protein